MMWAEMNTIFSYLTSPMYGVFGAFMDSMGEDSLQGEVAEQGTLPGSASNKCMQRMCVKNKVSDMYFRNSIESYQKSILRRSICDLSMNCGSSMVRFERLGFSLSFYLSIPCIDLILFEYELKYKFRWKFVSDNLVHNS